MILKTEPTLVPLFEAGLTDHDIIQAVLRGEMLRDSATANDPPTRAGFDAWAEVVRALREFLVPRGWSREDKKNLSVIATPCGRHAIAVSSGNSATGDASREPETKRPKGEATVFAVESNQGTLFRDPRFQPALPRTTWILLVHRQGDEVRCELSLPAVVSDGGVICGWAARHILPPICLDEALIGATARGAHDEEASLEAEEEIDVQVKKK